MLFLFLALSYEIVEYTGFFFNDLAESIIDGFVSEPIGEGDAEGESFGITTMGGIGMIR